MGLLAPNSFRKVSRLIVPATAGLLIDEIDALVGDGLLTVLRQLRAGYHLRPKRFPHSVILCGVRNLRDYRVHARSEPEPITDGSAFNISTDSLRLGDFTEGEIRALLAQHTDETGQAFLLEATQCIWTQTCGQPWLVNALCHQVYFRTERGLDRSRPITESDIREAKSNSSSGA